MSKRNGYYERVEGNEYRKIFVVGDLHGSFEKLLTRLSEINFDPHHDLLVSVGDLIDRGNKNIECLELIREPWFKAVKGNHEQMAIEAVSGHTNGSLWFQNGGEWYWHLDPDEKIRAKGLIQYASTLPLVIEVQTGNEKIVVAHADYPSQSYEFGKVLDPKEIMWSRERFSRIVDGEGSQIDGADQFYFGHTPIKKKAKAWNQNYIDTGAVFGGTLTIVQVQGGSNGEGD
ncbi:metallophosphoesterase [Winslowiella toletana]|uniref:metallophosphoesterase n=1 Tax=Winslowiella toletana TaxID=92490 RepID=UPI0028BE307A|nr:metallophosphoesterase [Winslowiella toletana]WNN42814.1 metallophosphoesterase [Winslowiella toletana]